jgi:hypothetical protein
MVSSRVFPDLKEATDFSNKQPINSVIEIKYYDNKTNNIQDQSHDYGSY